MANLDYVSEINKHDTITIDDIISIAHKFTPLNNNKNNTNRGTKIIDSEEDLNAYLVDYASMHKAKLDIAFKSLPSELFESPFYVVDWGCGQGLGTLELLSYTKAADKFMGVKLVDPSLKAIERAYLHISKIIDKSKIQKINSFFTDIKNDDLLFRENYPVIHIFSNIIDVGEISRSDLARQILQFNVSDNYLVVASPRYITGDERIEEFCSYFSNPDILFSEKAYRTIDQDYTYNINVLKITNEARSTKSVLLEENYTYDISVLNVTNEARSPKKEKYFHKFQKALKVTYHKASDATNNITAQIKDKQLRLIESNKGLQKKLSTAVNDKTTLFAHRLEKLTKSYRITKEYTSSTSIQELAASFQHKYLSATYDEEKYNDDIDSNQKSLLHKATYTHPLYTFSDIANSAAFYEIIIDYIDNNISKKTAESLASDDNIWNDIITLASKVKSLYDLDDYICDTLKMKTTTTFEDKEQREYSQNDIENIRKERKLHFYSNSNDFKLSTIHSFKGLEAKTAILFIDNSDDNDELIYTGLTRASENLLLFVQEESKYLDFFKNHNSIIYKGKV